MAVRLGILGVAHVHAPSYVYCCAQAKGAQLVGVWDKDPVRAEEFVAAHGSKVVGNQQELLDSVDAIVIVSENIFHKELALAAIGKGKHVLCEKPLATTVADANQMVKAAKDAGVILGTAFPCPYSPAFARLVERVNSGEIGKILAVNTTNRGSCPFGWFVEPDLSGGGAMIDHTVHVSDLLRRLLGKSPISVTASIGHQMYQQEWDDTAMLTLDYGDGLFATLDSSWSRHGAYKTWGDVTMSVIGEKGVIELDMFNQCMDFYTPGAKTHHMVGFGSNLDQMMVDEFIAAIEAQRDPHVTGEDGLAAVRVAEAGYESARSGATCQIAS